MNFTDSTAPKSNQHQKVTTYTIPVSSPLQKIQKVKPLPVLVAVILTSQGQCLHQTQDDVDARPPLLPSPATNLPGCSLGRDDQGERETVNMWFC